MGAWPCFRSGQLTVGGVRTSVRGGMFGGGMGEETWPWLDNTHRSVPWLYVVQPWPDAPSLCAPQCRLETQCNPVPAGSSTPHTPDSSHGAIQPILLCKTNCPPML